MYVMVYALRAANLRQFAFLTCIFVLQNADRILHLSRKAINTPEFKFGKHDRFDIFQPLRALSLKK
jgi:hypothetical protein